MFHVFFILFCTSFKVTGLTLRLMIHFVLTLVRGERMGPSVCLLHADISISRTIYWGCCFLFIIGFMLPCQKLEGCSCMHYHLGLFVYSIGLCVCFCSSTMLFLLLWLCNIVWSQVLCYLKHCYFYSELSWVFEVLCGSIWTSGLIFLISVRNVLTILMGI
jgi:hypothetical protein